MARRRVVYRNTTLRAAVALERLDPGVLIGAGARMRALVLLDGWLVLPRGGCILETILLA